MFAQEKRLFQDVEFLTSIRPYRNYLNTESLNKTVQYIQQEFKTLSLELDQQHWEAEGQFYKNVIASYNTSASKRLIIGAHYDVCGDQPGADDNASAVAGLLELARLVAETKPKLPYRIDFVAYCLEEPPFFGTHLMGSFVHAKSLYDAKVEVIGMVCLEMIGYFSEEKNSQKFPVPELASIYPNVGNFIMVVGIERFKNFTKMIFSKMKEDAGIGVYSIDFPADINIAGLSDHRNYWHFGFPAVMINDTSFLRNPHYHEITDSIETLDFPKMKAVVDAVYHAICNC